MCSTYKTQFTIANIPTSDSVYKRAPRTACKIMLAKPKRQMVSMASVSRFYMYNVLSVQGGCAACSMLCSTLLHFGGEKIAMRTYTHTHTEQSTEQTTEFSFCFHFCFTIWCRGTHTHRHSVKWLMMGNARCSL